MPKALVCLTTDSFTAEEVLAELRICDGVEEAYRVYGAYDIIAKISRETTESLLDFVTNQIEKLRSVQTAHTMLIVESEHPSEKQVLLI